jgi:hypothetical protein
MCFERVLICNILLNFYSKIHKIFITRATFSKLFAMVEFAAFLNLMALFWCCSVHKVVNVDETFIPNYVSHKKEASL